MGQVQGQAQGAQVFLLRNSQLHHDNKKDSLTLSCEVYADEDHMSELGIKNRSEGFSS